MKELNQDFLNYYKKQLIKLNSTSEITFKMSDDKGNSTNYLTLNKESVAALKWFIDALNVLNDKE
jgi:hypothetical protein